MLYKRFEDAQRAMNSIDGRLWEGQHIKVEYDPEVAVNNAILLEATINRMYGQHVTMPNAFNWKGLDYIFISYEKLPQLAIERFLIKPTFSCVGRPSWYSK